MKQYGFKYNNFEKLQSFIHNKKIVKYDKIFVQIFTGIPEKEFIQNVVNEIVSILPQAEIMGTTTGGEILKKRSYAHSTIISITVFETTKIKSRLLNFNNNEYELGKNIVKELVEKDTKVLFLFAGGLSANYSNILMGIQEANSNIIVCGGRAGDNGALKETFVFTKDGLSSNGVAVVSLSGEQLNITTEQSLGWSPIGKQMTITKVINNRVYTIDNIRAIDIYKKYLGEGVVKNIPMSTIQFPLIAIEDGVEMGKVPCSLNDDGSLNFYSNFEVNDKVRFGYGNINMIIDNAIEISNKLLKKNVEALFIYSCFVRKSFMQKKIDFNLSNLNNIAPTAGFFTYGEFFTINNSNKLLNVSMTVLGISEGKENYINKTERSIGRNKNFLDENEQGVIEVFTKLVDEATKELEETNDILEEQKRRVSRMNTITKSILQINSEMISSGEFEHFIEVLLDKILNVINKGKIGSILLVEKNKLCYKAGRGYDFEKIKKMTYNLDSVYLYNEINKNVLFNPMIIKNMEKDLFLEPDKYDYWRSIFNKEPREVLSCFIGIDGEVAGLITLINTEDEKDFDEEDKKMIKYICYDIAIALKNFRLLENILHMSRYDSLTGVCKRHYLREMLIKNINEAKINGLPLVIALIDLNDFKIINDTYGHDKGDEVLKTFAKVFKSGIDKVDILGRIGGDEFAAIFINKNKEQVINIIDKISVTLKNYDLKFDHKVNNIKFAYGLAEFLTDSESEDIEELIKIADKRMYEKKRNMKRN
ncbi:FIST N-terminal domain-containing protein [Clostridium sp.]|uniref:sensor domain-containing diguanylate cyclase n=1 Tax=Clostridium sp. TaxID=1506 RepID=UPI002847A9BB|nr:FIST N-terminal domain-containing protein [Clostridium sp.]MDR3594440.1 diguanylate cyclase [Clostridium sp.]